MNSKEFKRKTNDRKVRKIFEDTEISKEFQPEDEHDDFFIQKEFGMYPDFGSYPNEEMFAAGERYFEDLHKKKKEEK